MTSSPTSLRPLRAIVATPLGRGGQGGIDRVMDNLADAIACDGSNVSVDVLPTRGQGSAVWMAPLMARFLMRLLGGRLTGSIDIVHINVAQRGSIRRKAMVAQACNSLGIPYVLHVHGSQFHISWQQGGASMQRAMRRLIGHAARVIVLGSFWRDFLIEIGADPARVAIVPNATVHPPQANVHDRDRPAKILFLGHMGPRKGVPDLVEALKVIEETPWQATLAGNGDVDTTRARIVRLGLNDRVSVLGWAGPNEVKRLLAEHDILVLPSYHENLPMSVIEGMAHGMAVVTTPVGAVSDIIADEESGLLVPPGDVTALAQALRRCAEDPVLRQIMGARARAFHALHMDLADYPNRITDIWRTAVGAGSSR